MLWDRTAGTHVVVDNWSADPDKLAGLPQLLIDELAAALKGHALNKSIEIAGHPFKRIKEEIICNEVYIMAIGKEEKVTEIRAAAGLI